MQAATAQGQARGALTVVSTQALCTDWGQCLRVRLTISLLVKALGSFMLLFSKLHADNIFSLSSYLKGEKIKERELMTGHKRKGIFTSDSMTLYKTGGPKSTLAGCGAATACLAESRRPRTDATTQSQGLQPELGSLHEGSFRLHHSGLCDIME